MRRNGLQKLSDYRLNALQGLEYAHSYYYEKPERIHSFCTKGKDFNAVSEERIQAFEDKLNLRPRKRLGYKTPIEVLYDGRDWQEAE